MVLYACVCARVAPVPWPRGGRDAMRSSPTERAATALICVCGAHVDTSRPAVLGRGCSRNYVAASWYLVGLSRQFGLVKSMVAFRCDVPHMLLICRTDWVRAHVQRGRAPLHRDHDQAAGARPETADPRRPTRPPHGSTVQGPPTCDHSLSSSHTVSSAEPRASCNGRRRVARENKPKNITECF